MATAPQDPAAAIAAVIGLPRLADSMEREAVERAVDNGWTWQQIAQALGVTRQAHNSETRHGFEHPVPRTKKGPLTRRRNAQQIAEPSSIFWTDAQTDFTKKGGKEEPRKLNTLLPFPPWSLPKKGTPHSKALGKPSGF